MVVSQGLVVLEDGAAGDGQHQLQLQRQGQHQLVPGGGQGQEGVNLDSVASAHPPPPDSLRQTSTTTTTSLPPPSLDETLAVADSDSVAAEPSTPAAGQQQQQQQQQQAAPLSRQQLLRLEQHQQQLLHQEQIQQNQQRQLQQQQQHIQQQQLQFQQQQQFHQQQQQQQHHQHHQQHHLAMNGMNGANMGGGMPVPTPAGHQAELNYIYGMVEELSKQLADNRRVTEDIVSGLGKVRNRAKTQALGNDEVISSAAGEINVQEENIDALISILSESLEKAKFSRDANAALLSQYASALALILRQFHDYKSRHVADVAAWHNSYRAQLDEARRENSRLREQIWEMQTHAGKANESLRQFRRKYDEDEERWDRRVEDTAVRQQLRFWKRMAMPELDDDDLYWSGDDDIIDPAEKERLRELEIRAAQEQQLGDRDAEDSDGQGMMPHMAMMGGIAMQRDDGSTQGLQVPSRPLSVLSSTGSTGE